MGCTDSRRMRGFLPALGLLVVSLPAQAAGPTRVRHEGTFAKAAGFERFRIVQTGEKVLELQLTTTKDAATCTYEITWFRSRALAVVPMVDFQGTLRGSCAANTADLVDGSLNLDQPGDGGVIRLIGNGRATELAVDRASAAAKGVAP